MLLRRIISHVDEQNWFAVVIDFVIVVFGVFIGIQAANWNEAQGERRLGQYYTERLIADLESDLVVSAALLSYYRQVLTSVEETDRLLRTDGPEAQALVVAAYRATEFNNLPINSTTWDQIVSSGHIGLLPGAAVERGLSEYYKYQDSIHTMNFRLLESPYRLAVRSLIPLPTQLAIRQECSDVFDDLNNSIGFAADCVLDIGESELRSTAEALLSSVAVRETVRNHYSRVALATLNYEANILQIEDSLNALRSTPMD